MAVSLLWIMYKKPKTITKQAKHHLGMFEGKDEVFWVVSEEVPK